MRKIGLIVSVFIGFIGTAVYFMTIPTVDEEALVNIVVEAGDEQVLEDIYFNGYLYDYSDFHVVNGEVQTTEGLSYLEKIDTPFEVNLQLLRQSYPEFVDALAQNNTIYSKNIVFGENYLTSAHFEVSEGNYRIETETLHLNILDKETNTVKTENVDRLNELNGDAVEIIGLYEDYPRINVLLSVSNWPDDSSEATSQLLLGEYNIDTKVYTEEIFSNRHGSFYGEYIAQNKEAALIDYYSALEEGMHLFVYETQSFIPLESSNRLFLLDEDSQLFALANVDGETVLQAYEISESGGVEVIEDKSLVLDFELAVNPFEFAFIEASIIGDYLYVIQNTENYENQGGATPATLEVFNRSTGESVMSGSINFDEKNEVNARSGIVETIGQLSDF